MGQSYRDLIAWQKAMSFVMEVYRTTRAFPRDEVFGLASQTRRMAVAIPSNIAEGQARHTTREFIQFISHGEGSLAELDTQLTISSELDYCQGPMTALAVSISERAKELRRMLNSLRRRLEGMDR